MLRLAAAAALAATLALPRPAPADEPVDLGMVTSIREEGFRRSQVMEVLHHLTDVLGHRLTGSPQGRAASEWTRAELERWGLANARLEPYRFGRGWSFGRVSVRMVVPQEAPLPALPQAWTPGTAGAVRGAVVKAKIESEEDFEGHRGKLAGKILLVDDLAEEDDDGEDEPEPLRYTDDELRELTGFRIRPPRGEGWRARAAERRKREVAVREFLKQEGVLATVEVSSRGNGILRVGGGGSREPGEDPGVPALVMAREPYARLVRLLDRGTAVELEIDVEARFHDDDVMAHNTLAEIPGTDRKGEVVLVGAHLDSWHGATGATDNAAGCAVAMEAVRILKALDVKPRRTIRIALWTGEEQGLFGSTAYVKQHLAARQASDDPAQKDLPEWLRDETGPLEVKPGHAKLAAYYNLDNGSGKVRGVWAQGNAAVKPIFEAWLKPFADLGADTVTLRSTSGTDHVPFDRVGLPGFQFIQDPLDYRSHTHHTNIDTPEHVERDDLMQASVVLASFLYHTAMRPEMLPRKPMPEEETERRGRRERTEGLRER